MRRLAAPQAREKQFLVGVGVGRGRGGGGFNNQNPRLLRPRGSRGAGNPLEAKIARVENEGKPKETKENKGKPKKTRSTKSELYTLFWVLTVLVLTVLGTGSEV